jgi:cell wall-associated NlpC family hydrolase
VAKNLSSLVGTMYRTGNVDLDVQALFSDNPSQFLQEMSAIQQVGNTQLVTLKRIRASRLNLQQAQAAVRAEQAIGNKLIVQAAQNKRTAYARLARATALLNSLKASQRAALLARQRAQVAASAKSAAVAASSLRAATAPMSARALRVVQYALSKVGDRYVWGGSGPVAFDCTGLTMMSYRQIGISLAHDGYTQRRETRNVPRSQVRPGDLVFFFGHGLGHVGMYIGNGRFVHAAKPGTGVIVSSLNEPYYSARLTGFGRVIG